MSPSAKPSASSGGHQRADVKVFCHHSSTHYLSSEKFQSQRHFQCKHPISQGSPSLWEHRHDQIGGRKGVLSDCESGVTRGARRPGRGISQTADPLGFSPHHNHLWGSQRMVSKSENIHRGQGVGGGEVDWCEAAEPHTTSSSCRAM